MPSKKVLKCLGFIKRDSPALFAFASTVKLQAEDEEGYWLVGSI